MISLPAENRSQGHLIAFIDLLFLLVAFFTLLLFFIQQERISVVDQLQRTQQELAETQQEKTAIDAIVESLQPFMEKLAVQREAGETKRRKAEEMARRRGAKERIKIDYTLQANGSILYKGRAYPLERFLREVIEPLRARRWIAFRGYAKAETPFGRVVETRRRLLENQGEFDTYWDNLTRSR